MIQLTQLTDSLIAVEVPIDAFNIGLKFDTLHYDSKGQQTANFYLPVGNYTILGEVSKNDISFNCHKYLDKKEEMETDNPNWSYRDYNHIKNEDDEFDYENYYFFYNEPDESLRTLLQSKGCILNSDNKFIILKRTNHE